MLNIVLNIVQIALNISIIILILKNRENEE